VIHCLTRTRCRRTSRRTNPVPARRTFDRQVSVRVGSPDPDIGVLQERDRLLARVTEVIAGSNAHQRVARRPARKADLGESVLTAVMRNLEDVSVSEHSTVGDALLRSLLGISGEHDGRRCGAHLQNDARVVGTDVIGSIRSRPQHPHARATNTPRRPRLK